MTDKENVQNQPDELALLKQRATVLGVEFSNNIGIDTLRERVNAKLAEDEAGTVEEQEGDAPKAEPTKLTIRQKLIKENMRLVRVRVTNLDPKKKEMPGEIFTIANEYIGTVRKFIPYGEATDGGYHIPYCLFKMLKRKKFNSIQVRKDKQGNEQVNTRWVPEFSLEVLPDLTPKELKQLAQAQIAAGSVD